MSARSSSPLVVVGDVLLDRDIDGQAERLCPDAPVPVVDERAVRERPGGAGLAAYLAAHADPDREVVLVTALGDDAVSDRLRELLAGDVTILELPLDAPPPEKTRIWAGHRPLLRLDRGGGGIVGDASPAAIRDTFAVAGAVLVSDYGQGVTANGQLRAQLEHRTGRAPLVWDPHPSGAAPVRGAQLATPSLTEAASFADARGGPSAHAPAGGEREDTLHMADACARYLAGAWKCSAVAITLGERGALVSFGAASPLIAPVSHDGRDRTYQGAQDTCGAGDRFAAAAALALAAGALPSEAVLAAVDAASGFVAAGGASGTYLPGAASPVATAGPFDDAGSAAELVARTHAAGGTVVATGGCFDVLHAGHVATLRTARSLGDCLIVCLNSDASVQRLKGTARPINTAADRAAILRALACVDAVEIFDEPTPEAVLAQLRPNVWVKGGDYGGADLPESALLSQWGGQTVAVPYVPGHSTTRLVAAAPEG